MRDIDPTPRIIKVLDAVSQLGNVALLPHHTTTNANESISGRAYRQGLWLRKLIDALFFWQTDHCRQSHLADLERARQTVNASEKNP